MSSRCSIANTWVIVAVRRQEFAVPAAQVREILTIPDVTAVPLCRPQDRGVINLRGRVMPLIDLRKLFGWQSVPEELADFYKLMDQREEDHRNWLKALEKSVTEGVEFRLGTDPHKCAFGRWYDSYRSESPWITALLRKFESPHNKIHALASSVIELANGRKTEEALRLIEQKRNRELLEMITLFQGLKQLMRETVKEVAVVLTSPENTFAVAVDSAVAVEGIPPDLIKELPANLASLGCSRVTRVAERKASKSLVMILEAETFGASAAA